MTCPREPYGKWWPQESHPEVPLHTSVQLLLSPQLSGHTEYPGSRGPVTPGQGNRTTFNTHVPAVRGWVRCRLQRLAAGVLFAEQWFADDF